MRVIANNCELNILVHGKVLEEYSYKDKVFIEGRKGSDFELQFRNNTAKRVLFVPSVDGLSTIEGRTVTKDTKGYIVNPYTSMKVPGWTIDPNNVAKFFFNDKKGSYASTTGKSEQVGVIGAAEYSEKVRPVHIHMPYVPPIEPAKPSFPAYPVWPGPQYPNDRYWCGVSVAPNTNYQLMNTVVGSSVDLATTASQTSAQADATQSSSVASKTTKQASTGRFELGTGFGHKEKFETTTVSFERDSLIAIMEVYYDSRRNLIKYGIIEEVKHEMELPHAFPNLYCDIPKGWKG